MTAYGSAAMGQLFFFHVILIKKGIRTYDYILAMKEEINQSKEIDPFNDNSDFSSSDESSSDFDSPEKPSCVSRIICGGGQGGIQNHRRLSIRIDGDPRPSLSTKSQGFRVRINPWTLIKLSKEKALFAAEKAIEKIVKQKPSSEHDSLRPLPLETKSGPLTMSTDRNIASATAAGIWTNTFNGQNRVDARVTYRKVYKPEKEVFWLANYVHWHCSLTKA